MKFLTDTLPVGRMSKRIESKDHTIRRLRGQRDILRRVAQAPVKEVQENNEGNEVLAHVKAVHGRGNDKREELRKFSHFHEQQPCV